MNIRHYFIAFFNVISCFLVVLASSISAAEKIIQQEKMSFETCLEVIKTSESRLSIAPEVDNINSQKRVAVFSLSDGKLKISCDGEKGLVFVVTTTN